MQVGPAMESNFFSRVNAELAFRPKSPGAGLEGDWVLPARGKRRCALPGNDAVSAYREAGTGAEAA